MARTLAYKLKDKHHNNIYTYEFDKAVDKDGNEMLQIIADDCVIMVRPRLGAKPTLILFSVGIGIPQILKHEDKQLILEIFSDKSQIGMGPNPINLDQIELLKRYKEKQEKKINE